MNSVRGPDEFDIIRITVVPIMHFIMGFKNELWSKFMIPKDDNFIVVNDDTFIVIVIQQLSVKYTQVVRGPLDSRFPEEAPLGRLDDMLMDMNLINARKKIGRMKATTICYPPFQPRVTTTTGRDFIIVPHHHCSNLISSTLGLTLPWISGAST